MTNEEIMSKAFKASNYVMETIEQLLSYPEKINSKINFTYAKINGKDMCTFNIFCPKLEIKDYINTGVPLEYSDLLHGQIFNDLLDKFLESETVMVGRYYTRIYEFHLNNEDVHGMDYKNFNGSCITLNFDYRGEDFKNIVAGYRNRINEYKERNKNEEGSKSK